LKSKAVVWFGFLAQRSLFVFEKQDFKSYKPATTEDNNWCGGDAPNQNTNPTTLPTVETVISLARARSSLLRLSYVTLPITPSAPVVPLFQLFSYSLIYLFLFFFFLNFIEIRKKNGTLEQIVVKSY